jgi:hypothetical protein
MTGALTVYSATFMRYSLAVTPKNYLLFACHAINFTSQTIQGYRYLNYWKYVRPPPIPSHPQYHTIVFIYIEVNIKEDAC